MTREKAGLVLCLAALVAGCGGPVVPTDPGPPPPHGGSLVNLPRGQGFVEIVKKPVPAGAQAGGEVSFYFLKDMTTPFSPAPTSGTLTSGKKSVPLRSEGDALVTPGGARVLARGELDGELVVELDGKTTTIPLGVR